MLRLRLSSDSDGQRGLKWRQERWWWWWSSKVEHDDCCVRNHRRRKETHLKSQTAEIHLTCGAMRVSPCELDNCWNIWLQSSNLTQPPVLQRVQTTALADARLTCYNCLMWLINWCIHLSIQDTRHERHMRMNHELKSLPSFGQSETPCQKNKKKKSDPTPWLVFQQKQTHASGKNMFDNERLKKLQLRELWNREETGAEPEKRYSNHWNYNQFW